MDLEDKLKIKKNYQKLPRVTMKRIFTTFITLVILMDEQARRSTVAANAA